MATKDEHTSAAPPLLSRVLRAGVLDEVTIEVGTGTEKTKYRPHKSFLIHYSEYFRKALSGSWKEAEDGVITLEDVEPAVFNMFVDWLYTQKLPAGIEAWYQSSDTPEDVDDMVGMEVLRIKLYVFADRFIVPILRTTLNRLIVADTTCRLAPFPDVTSYAFENLPTEDPILAFFVDTNALFCDTYGMEEAEHDLAKHPRLFLVRTIRKMTTMRSFDPPACNQCDYHEHQTEDEKEACAKQRK
ncbi:hypothetical protein BDV95DRAFT_606028 [Massariosphaeria phaeospora]|uniref:BTB domain-containing protein n=1 Tax=Massariosphaeria phaeospora TaxID=100035 RepID=A0A7C8IAM6_9PLEO|nr:hypothetical protein BDV95DRAFT_606028 [Massariosphaeria phaeospora]